MLSCINLELEIKLMFFFFFADLEMSFDPSKLLENVNHIVKGPKSKVSALSKGKKRARKAVPTRQT